MRHTIRSSWLVIVSALAACGGTTTGTTSTESSSTNAQALAAAQESYATFRAQAEQCRATFESCVTAQNDDRKACADALHACLPAHPPPPPACADGGAPPPPRDCDGDGDGGRMPPPPPSGSAPPPPPPSGSAPPPPPPDGDAAPPPPPPSGSAPPPPPPRGHHGDHDGPPPFCGGLPLPPPEELAACRADLEACLDGGGDRKTCFDTHRACAHDAFQRPFHARCASGGTDVTTICASGIGD